MEQFIKSEKKISHLVNEQDYFIIEWNTDNKFDCSESFENLVGCTSDEITNLPFKHHSLAKENNDDEFIIALSKLNSENPKIKIDFEIKTKDGKHLWFREFVNYSGSEDKTNYSSILFNITDFKKQEIELNELVSAKTKLNESKDKLIAIISHDLRAPFSSLLGFSEILINEPNLPEKERVEFLQYIYDASDVQLQMVNHLLDWTRLQSGTMKFDPQRLDIRDIVDNCVSVLTGSVIRKEIEIKVNGEHNTFVTADERLISQVVTNLLSNAVKFTPSGKKITVTIDLFKQNMVEVIVADEGVGIEEKYQDKLFRIDAKFSKAGTAGEKGSGLGLSLVKEIVEKHSGNIWFYSEVNKGSEFHFTLPKAEDTVLIIEEHEELQNHYRKVFNEKFSQYKLEFSKNGFEALNFLREKTPSVLISYHNMELMNGVQIASSLRKKDLYNKVSVIILGDNLQEKEKQEYSSLNVKTFLDVNSSPEELTEVLEKLI